MIRTLGLGFGMLFLLTTPVSAQLNSSNLSNQLPSPNVSVETTIDSEVTVSPNLPSTNTVMLLPFSTQTRAPLAWLRFRRFLTTNPINDSELTLAIANRLVSQIDDSDPVKGASLLDTYNREVRALQGLTDTVLANTTDPRVNSFLTVLMTDKTAQITALEAIDLQAGSELGRKIINARAKALKEIVKILEHPNLSPAQQQEKLNIVMQKYSETEAKIDRKISRKLTLKDELDEETDDLDLEDKLAKEEDDTLEEAANKLDKDELADFANELRRKEGEQSLVVLQKLLVTVPDAAKSGIETAIDAVIAKRIDTFRQDPTMIEQLLNEHSGSSKVRTLLLERIKEQAKDENLKQQIELIKAKPEERLKKTKELQKENEKKAKEKQKEDAKKQLQNQKETKSPEVKTSERPEIKVSPSPEIKSEASTIEIKIKEDGTLEKTSYTVKKNSVVTIKIGSASLNSTTINFSDDLGAITVSKELTKSLNPFTITNNVNFTVNGVTGYIYTE